MCATRRFMVPAGIERRLVLATVEFDQRFFPF
jgi:hypothetical protein